MTFSCNLHPLIDTKRSTGTKRLRLFGLVWDFRVLLGKKNVFGQLVDRVFQPALNLVEMIETKNG